MDAHTVDQRQDRRPVNIEGIMSAKGRTVETIFPAATVADAVQRMTATDIGALVVTSDGQKILGMVSERDVVRGLGKYGPAVCNMAVSEVMSRGGPTCKPDDSLPTVMSRMTRRRARHLPVVDGDRLSGLVSIGDVIAARLSEVELETGVLRDMYIAGH
jgi:CBS domain-containing protein